MVSGNETTRRESGGAGALIEASREQQQQDQQVQEQEQEQQVERPWTSNVSRRRSQKQYRRRSSCNLRPALADPPRVLDAELLSQLRAKALTSLPFWGISMDPSDTEIDYVWVDGPAYTAGIRPRDVITRINGRSIGSYEEFVAGVKESQVGTETVIVCERAFSKEEEEKGKQEQQQRRRHSSSNRQDSWGEERSRGGGVTSPGGGTTITSAEYRFTPVTVQLEFAPLEPEGLFYDRSKHVRIPSEKEMAEYLAAKEAAGTIPAGPPGSLALKMQCHRSVPFWGMSVGGCVRREKKKGSDGGDGDGERNRRNNNRRRGEDGDAEDKAFEAFTSPLPSPPEESNKEEVEEQQQTQTQTQMQRQQPPTARRKSIASNPDTLRRASRAGMSTSMTAQQMLQERRNKNSENDNTKNTSSSSSSTKLKIDYVWANGPAFKAGIQPGDVIRSINGHTVTSYSDCCVLLQRMEVVKMTCERVEIITARATTSETATATPTAPNSFTVDSTAAEQGTTSGGRGRLGDSSSTSSSNGSSSAPAAETGTNHHHHEQRPSSAAVPLRLPGDNDDTSDRSTNNDDARKKEEETERHKIITTTTKELVQKDFIIVPMTTNPIFRDCSDIEFYDRRAPGNGKMMHGVGNEPADYKKNSIYGCSLDGDVDFRAELAADADDNDFEKKQDNSNDHNHNTGGGELHQDRLSHSSSSSGSGSFEGGSGSGGLLLLGEGSGAFFPPALPASSPGRERRSSISFLHHHDGDHQQESGGGGGGSGNLTSSSSSAQFTSETVMAHHHPGHRRRQSLLRQLNTVALPPPPTAGSGDNMKPGSSAMLTRSGSGSGSGSKKVVSIIHAPMSHGHNNSNNSRRASMGDGMGTPIPSSKSPLTRASTSSFSDSSVDQHQHHHQNHQQTTLEPLSPKSQQLNAQKSQLHNNNNNHHQQQQQQHHGRQPLNNCVQCIYGLFGIIAFFALMLGGIMFHETTQHVKRSEVLSSYGYGPHACRVESTEIIAVNCCNTASTSFKTSSVMSDVAWTTPTIGAAESNSSSSSSTYSDSDSENTTETDATKKQQQQQQQQSFAHYYTRNSRCPECCYYMTMTVRIFASVGDAAEGTNSIATLGKGFSHHIEGECDQNQHEGDGTTDNFSLWRKDAVSPCYTQADFAALQLEAFERRKNQVQQQQQQQQQQQTPNTPSFSTKDETSHIPVLLYPPLASSASSSGGETEESTTAAVQKGEEDDNNNAERESLKNNGNGNDGQDKIDLLRQQSGGVITVESRRSQLDTDERNHFVSVVLLIAGGSLGAVVWLVLPIGYYCLCIRPYDT